MEIDAQFRFLAALAHDQNRIWPESRTLIADVRGLSGTPARLGPPKKEENAMNSRLFYGTIVLALACDVGTGTAQIQLDAAQRAAIVIAVRDVRIAPPGHSFNISVGAQVPPSIELNYLPVAALSQAPEARGAEIHVGSEPNRAGRPDEHAHRRRHSPGTVKRVQSALPIV